MNLAGGDAGKADDPGRVARQRERVEPDRLRLTRASVATESVNQPLIKKSDRLRLTRASVATESVNQSLIKESDRLRLTRASLATESVNQPLIKELERGRGRSCVNPNLSR